MKPKKKSRPRVDKEDEIRLIGCCGAYCMTCRSYILGDCVGCKLGYDDGSRSIARTRCKIKICCFGDKKLETCADCQEFYSCKGLKSFTARKGWYGEMYRGSLIFIRENGYPEFIRRSRDWKRQYGEL